MNTVNIKHCAERLEKSRDKLVKAIEMRNMLDFKGHQEALVIKIAGITTEVSFYNRLYQHQVKRGYEMVHLGLIKIANSAIDDAKAEVSKIEQELKQLVGA